jgi:hypothetical protein
MIFHCVFSLIRSSLKVNSRSLFVKHPDFVQLQSAASIDFFLYTLSFWILRTFMIHKAVDQLPDVPMKMFFQPIFMWKPWPIGSMVLPYMVTWIPSIYPLYVSIYTSTMDPMGWFNVSAIHLKVELRLDIWNGTPFIWTNSCLRKQGVFKQIEAQSWDHRMGMWNMNRVIALSSNVSINIVYQYPTIVDTSNSWLLSLSII